MTDREDLVGMLVALVAVATLPLGVLAAVFLGFTPAVVVFVVGWLLLVPAIAIIGETLFVGTDGETTGALERSEPDRTEPEDPVATLRERYARGELSDEEFESRVERLLETEDVDVPTGARIESAAETGVDRGRDGHEESTVERE